MESTLSSAASKHGRKEQSLFQKPFGQQCALRMSKKALDEGLFSHDTRGTHCAHSKLHSLPHAMPQLRRCAICHGTAPRHTPETLNNYDSDNTEKTYFNDIL